VSFLSDRPNLADAALQCCLLSMRVQKHQKHKGDSPRGAKVAGERPRPLPEGKRETKIGELSIHRA
jgi:hypothetical protein